MTVRAVDRLGRSDRENVVRLLTAAFFDYPVMRYVVGDHDYESRVKNLIAGYTDMRLDHDWPVLGCRVGGELRAAALISPAGAVADPEVVGRLEHRLRAALGRQAYERMERFEAASDANGPDGPHHFVGMLGVLPGAQGRGLGRTVLEAVKRMAVEDGLKGVSLSTEDPANLPFYKHMGFRVNGHTDLGALKTWCLVWRAGEPLGASAD